MRPVSMYYKLQQRKRHSTSVVLYASTKFKPLNESLSLLAVGPKSENNGKVNVLVCYRAILVNNSKVSRYVAEIHFFSQINTLIIPERKKFLVSKTHKNLILIEVP